jgi:hypothetical protein
MRLGPIVEQILSPYCALEYIDQEAKSMDDFSVFTCVARCQKIIPIPDEINVKIPQSKTATSLFLNRYRVFVGKNEYIQGVTKRCRYISDPNVASASRLVSPAECYISPRMLNLEAIQKYSSAVVLHPKAGTYFADLCHVCVFFIENIHIRIQIKMLNDRAFLLSHKIPSTY